MLKWLYRIWLILVLTLEELIQLRVLVVNAKLVGGFRQISVMKPRRCRPNTWYDLFFLTAFWSTFFVKILLITSAIFFEISFSVFDRWFSSLKMFHITWSGYSSKIWTGLNSPFCFGSRANTSANLSKTVFSISKFDRIVGHIGHVKDQPNDLVQAILGVLILTQYTLAVIAPEGPFWCM